MDHKDFSNFNWLNESSIRFENEAMVLYAPKDSDFFCNNGTVSEEGITPSSLTNAPFFTQRFPGIL